ncbi:MAG: Asp-tRNA(Asn)/Glu-tRNA(Gln) amidotransferase subunit GatC [Erysipelotrichaceae bacterium]|jgi:aspartyl-tRNA(Asn)/glutamyl-tRNA(Gln) amidotransferase subunit C|nr:Asp-tRNA(Asn)/Glu-tRNA(Gln) amidotransferase subunit GatC [Erysipelotrichaceae bacterium]
MESKEYFKKLALNLMFEISDEEAENIIKEFATFNEQLKIFDEIDTEGVEEMVYPFDVETTYLREDVPDHYLTKQEALSNVSKEVEGHFVLPRVLK